MDGRSQNFLTRKIDIFELSQQGNEDPKVSVCYIGVVNVGRRNLENTEYEQQHSRVKIMTKPDQALYYWTPALNSQHQRLEVS